MVILRIIYGVFFCFAGLMHIIKPKFFKNFIPSFLPKLTVNYAIGVLELLLGLGLFFIETTKNAALSILILMIVFFPIHIWDATKIKPAIGSKKIAFIRILLQFILIYGAYIIFKNS